MSNKFLGTTTNITLGNGTANIYGATIGASSLDPSMPVKTNSLRQLVSTKLNTSDINGLDTKLNGVLTSPFTGTLVATDYESSDFFSVNDELHKIANITSATESPDITNISGLVSCDAISANTIYNTTQTVWATLDPNTIDFSATNLRFNGDDIITTPYANQIEATSFVKTGGNSNQYLMANGSILESSANAGNSNFYLYDNTNSISDITPVNGEVIINSNTNTTATIVYISHISRDNIDVEVYWQFINQLTDLYIQDQSLSTNYVRYNISGTPTITVGNKIAIPVIHLSSAGTGATTFGSGHNILVAYFANTIETDQRITNLETKSQNQSAIPNTTTITGILKTDDIRSLDISNNTINISSDTLNIGTGQSNTNIFNNGSSLTKNNFNTSQSVGCIGFKDNWATATGNNASIKQGMVYMSNVGRFIVVSNIVPQYFDDATGALINCIGGLNGISQVYVYIPSLGLIYGRNLTQYTTSSDGITFSTPQNILGDIGVNSFPKMIYGNGLYITSAGTSPNIIQTSTDGITWTNRASTRNIFSIIYTGSRFITFGASGCMYSIDGITWFDDTVQLNNIRAVIYCDTLGCILAQIYGGNRNIIRSYDNGLTWTTLTNVFPFSVNTNKMLWDSGSGKAYYMADDSLSPINSYLWEFDDTGNPALGGSIQMMGKTSTPASDGLTDYIYNPSIKRFLFTRNTSSHPVFYSTTSNNLAVSGNQYIIGSLNCSGGYNPYGLANIDIMLRDSPFIGLQYNNGTAVNTLSNTLFSQLGNTGQFAPTFALTNNFTRQLICADWITVSLADGIPCGYASNGTNGCRVGSGFNFGLSAILGIADSTYNVNNCQNFWGLWNSSNAIPLTQSIQLSVQRNMICFGSDTNDPNICIYTAGASSTVKQVDLGVSFPANRPSAALSTDWFKFTLYWDVTKIYYKAHNTTTHVIVSGSFTPLATDMPLSNIVLLPQCVRIQGSPQSNGQGRLKVQRFGVYY